MNAILILNVGSSSIKFALYDDIGMEPSLLLEGKLAATGQEQALQARWAGHDRQVRQVVHTDTGSAAALDAVLDWLQAETGDVRLVAAGHRIVHGGPDYAEPVRITPAVLDGVARYNPAAPYHNQHNLAGVRAVQQRYPGLPQVACFDTYFHHTQPQIERLFGLPRRFAEQGIRRYGFHGLSYEFIASELPHRDPAAAQGRTLVAHLGNGASMCAIRAGRSIAATMGFTALDGLLMGRRCGALDPGVVLYLIRELGYSPDEVAQMLYRDSGLLGISGVSNDMRELLDSEESTAQEAVALFCHRAVREAGALIALLGGLDALVFTGGIGENAAPVRQRIVAGLAWLGLNLDVDVKRADKVCLSAANSSARIWVIPTDEERVIARHTRRVLEQTQGET